MLPQIRIIWNTFSLKSSSQNCTIFVTLHKDKKYLSATTGMVSRCVTFTQQFNNLLTVLHFIWFTVNLICLFLSVDPHQRERYLKSSNYLAPLNGEIEHANLTGNLRLHYYMCNSDGCLCTFSSVALSHVVLYASVPSQRGETASCA